MQTLSVIDIVTNSLHGYSSHRVAMDAVVGLDAQRADSISCCAMGIP
jgi:hypothetical protein